MVVKKYIIFLLMVLFIGLVAADASVFVDTDYNNNSIYDISNVTSLGYCNATDCYTVSQLLSDFLTAALPTIRSAIRPSATPIT